MLFRFARRQRALRQAFGNDLLRQRVLRIERAKLRQQTFAQVARRHAQRIELLHDGQRFLDVFHRIFSVLRDLLERRAQVAVLIEVADDRLGDLPHHVVANRDAQLPGKMLGKSLRRGKKFIEGGTLDDLAFAAILIAAAAAQVLVEKRGYVEFFERTGGFGLRNFLGLRFQEGFVAVIFGDNRVLGQLFQHRVFDHLLIDHFPEFEAIQRQHAHHLDQARGKDLLLGYPEVKFWCEPVHGSQFKRK